MRPFCLYGASFSFLCPVLSARPHCCSQTSHKEDKDGGKDCPYFTVKETEANWRKATRPRDPAREQWSQVSTQSSLGRAPTLPAILPTLADHPRHRHTHTHITDAQMCLCTQPCVHAEQNWPDLFPVASSQNPKTITQLPCSATLSGQECEAAGRESGTAKP